MRPAILPQYQGDFLAWTGGAALIGEGRGAIALHSHCAIQLSIGSPSGLRVRFGRYDERGFLLRGVTMNSKGGMAFELPQAWWCVLDSVSSPPTS